MPRRKKKAHEQTTDEALKRLFPRPVVRHLKQLAESGKPMKRKGNKHP